MTLYNSFVGVDIGKFSFVVAVHNQKQTKEYANDAIGIKAFMQDHCKYFSDSRLRIFH